MNKLMQRIYTAQMNGEHPILDQIESDIQLAKDEGGLDTEQYRITPNEDDSVTIHDKINDELTKASDSEAGIKLEEISTEDEDTKSELKVGDPVEWMDGDKDKHVGKIVEINGKSAKVTSNDKIVTVNVDKLNQMEFTQDRGFSTTLDRTYLVDEKGNLMAFGLKQSLGKLHKDHPNWKMLNQYDFNKFNSGVTKKFSNLSEENQKLFTRQNRRFVILDGSGKRQTTVDLSNVKGMLQKNKGWTAVKETVYNQGIQKKFSNMSEATLNLLANKGSLRTAK